MTNLLPHLPANLLQIIPALSARTIQHPDMFLLTEAHQANSWFDWGEEGSGSYIKFPNSHI